MTMRKLKLKAVLVTAAVGLGVLATAACGKNGQEAEPAAPATPTAASSPAAPSPAVSSPAATPTPAATAATPTGGRPQVTLTDDEEAASIELIRLRKAGWFNPNKIEYADDAVIALQQFKRWLDAGYIAPDGSWTAEGLAAVERANKSGTPL
ncbi:hypothetical protein OG625_01655 [Streptomyces sp. NBC_01351]|uniref:hypothetical protein n=1 Tax=Streptomyces sp. NBC_01351 TaxID=2903833 RepID=UPI002E3385B4|nr:hypothetical protein [Streptomyces sp. NBC_01351]